MTASLTITGSFSLETKRAKKETKVVLITVK